MARSIETKEQGDWIKKIQSSNYADKGDLKDLPVYTDQYGG